MPPEVCTAGLDSSCDMQLGQTRVTLDKQTLTLSPAQGPATWQITLLGDDQFKQILGLVPPDGTARLVYITLHCPSQCLNSDVIVLDHLDRTPPDEAFHSQRFGVGASVTVLPNGDMNVADQIFQPGDMCCPSGTTITHFTWNGATYVAQ